VHSAANLITFLPHLVLLNSYTTEMELMLECLTNEMKASISASLDETVTPIANEEKMDATIRAGQENMEAVMSITQNVQTEFIKTGNKCGTLT
jgi:hypothetical protein